MQNGAAADDDVDHSGLLEKSQSTLYIQGYVSPIFESIGVCNTQTNLHEVS